MLKDVKGTLARLLLAAAVACASAAVGLAAPRGPVNACPMMAGAHACCKKARRRAADSSRLLPSMPCCVTNTPQPAPAGTNYNVRPAPGAATDARPSSATPAPAHVAAHARDRAPLFSPTHSPPAYIRHASFLI